MLISSYPRFIFCAFNKTGSTSIERALSPYNNLWRYWLLRHQYNRLNLPVAFKHARPVVLRHLLGETTWRTSFKFCFVRNPFERLVSIYSYHRQKVADRHPLASKLDFESWVLKGGSGSTVRLMSEFICDEEGREIFDFVGRFETLDADFAAVCERLGLSARLPHNNVSAHRHYSVYYSDAARVAVEEMLGADLERFGYRFERPRRLTVRRDAASPALHEPNVERDRKLRLVGE